MTLKNKILGTIFALFITALVLVIVKLTMGVVPFVIAIVGAIALNIYVAYRTYIVNKDNTTE